jgi:hypothetical protein
MTMDELTGGRVETIIWIQSLLDKHPVYNWENYAVCWEVDHDFSLSKMKDHRDPCERKRVNHFTNLKPMERVEVENKSKGGKRRSKFNRPKKVKLPPRFIK